METTLGEEKNYYSPGDLSALGRPHGIGRENNEQTKLTMEPSPKAKELRSIGIQLNKRFRRAARLLLSPNISMTAIFFILLSTHFI